MPPNGLISDPSRIQARILKSRTTSTGIPEKEMGTATALGEAGGFIFWRGKQGAGIKTEE